MSRSDVPDKADSYYVSRPLSDKEMEEREEEAFRRFKELELISPCGDGRVLAYNNPYEMIQRLKALEAENIKLKEELETERLRLAGCGAAALGYHKKDDTLKPEYDSTSLQDTMRLYEKYQALLNKLSDMETEKSFIVVPAGCVVKSIEFMYKPQPTLDHIDFTGVGIEEKGENL